MDTLVRHASDAVPAEFAHGVDVRSYASEGRPWINEKGERVAEGPWAVTVIVPDGRGGQVGMDPDSVLFQTRVIDFAGEVNTYSIAALRKELWILNAQDPNAPIHLYVNSPGGAVFEVLSLYDVRQSLTAPLHTYAHGMVASAGSLIFMMGDAGKRHALPNAMGMIHQLRTGGVQGTYTDLMDGMALYHHLEINRLEKIYAKHTGRSVKVIAKWMQNGDNWLTATDMVERGLADDVWTQRLDGTPMQGFIPHDRMPELVARMRPRLTKAEQHTSAEFRRVRAAATETRRGASAGGRAPRPPHTSDPGLGQ